MHGIRTDRIVAQLPADNGSICIIPSIITHCTPGIVDADLHPTLSWEVTIAESYRTISAGCIG